MSKLRASAVRSAGWLFLRAGGRQAANTAAFFTIAALVSPAAFGLASIAAALAMILRAALQRGLRDIVIQRAELSAEALDTAFWLNLCLAGVLSLGLLVATPLVVLAYGQPSLGPLIAVSSLLPLIAGLSAIQEARLEREFRHRTLTIAQLCASLLAAVIGIGLALSGAGAWALIFYNIVEAAALTMVTLALARWLPGLRFSFTEARSQIRFAWPLMVSFTFTNGNLRFAQLVVGLILGPQATAYFRVGSQVNQFLTQTVAAPIVRVLLPAFSRLEADFGRHYVRALAAVCAFAFPAFLGAAAVAPAILPKLMGDDWQIAADLSGILCFAVFAAVPLQVLTPALIARGQPAMSSRLSIGSVVAGLLATTVGAFFGIFGAAFGFAARSVVTTPAGLLTASRILGASWGAQMRAILAYGAAALACYLSARLLLLVDADGIAAWGIIAGAVVLGASVYALAVRFGIRWAAPDAYEPLKAAAPARLRKYL
ncbi:lipopolysaccharide biosynthesis protein [Phenylobacterium sp.]|uniref:lipopolysaccharide biosynthesis protein n=1 Tax=Phenylobacterium sp. TaxID=1871053 RepID=UPI003001BB90